MYDVTYVDGEGNETPVAHHVEDRGEAADMARREAAVRGVGRMMATGSARLPNCVCVVPVDAPEAA